MRLGLSLIRILAAEKTRLYSADIKDIDSRFSVIRDNIEN